jgi:hypothetical protein
MVLHDYGFRYAIVLAGFFGRNNFGTKTMKSVIKLQEVNLYLSLIAVKILLVATANKDCNE